MITQVKAKDNHKINALNFEIRSSVGMGYTSFARILV